jgi:hypothetical protein
MIVIQVKKISALRDPGRAEVWINVVQCFITYLWSSDFLMKSVSWKQDPLTPEIFFLTDLLSVQLPFLRLQPHFLMIPQPNDVQKE